MGLPALRLIKKRGPRPFSKLRRCPSFGEAHDRLARGEPANAVAAWLSGKGEYGSASAASLKSVLLRYRRSLPPAEVLSRIQAPMIRDAKSRLDRGLDELDALERAYKMQLERVEREVEIEQKLGKLLPSTRREVDLLRQLLTTRATVKKELGLTGGRGT